jgi:NAD(P)-dependent dehydrogenase (short-subunit alcohol dehydrogenase family)
MTKQTWLITGASSGLGHALAEHVLREGDNAVLAARGIDALRALAAPYPERALPLRLDVTDAAQRKAAVELALDRFGGIDVLVNNAAIDYVGAIEEQAEADYRRTFEVNYFGAVEMIRLLLPGMRARKQGMIVNVSSMDGFASLPANGFYSSSKFALEGLTEALWQEIEPIGLQALIVQPGSFRTGIENRTLASGEPIGDYAATAGAFRSVAQTVTPEMFPGDPVRAARQIWAAVKSADPPHWLILGSDAYRRISVKLQAFQAEIDHNRDVAPTTDYPDAGPPVL